MCLRTIFRSILTASNNFRTRATRTHLKQYICSFVNVYHRIHFLSQKEHNDLIEYLLATSDSETENEDTLDPYTKAKDANSVAASNSSTCSSLHLNPFWSNLPSSPYSPRGSPYCFTAESSGCCSLPSNSPSSLFPSPLSPLSFPIFTSRSSSSFTSTVSSKPSLSVTPPSPVYSGDSPLSTYSPFNPRTPSPSYTPSSPSSSSEISRHESPTPPSLVNFNRQSSSHSSSATEYTDFTTGSHFVYSMSNKPSKRKIRIRLTEQVTVIKKVKNWLGIE